MENPKTFKEMQLCDKTHLVGNIINEYPDIAIIDIMEFVGLDKTVVNDREMVKRAVSRSGHKLNPISAHKSLNSDRWNFRKKYLGGKLTAKNMVFDLNDIERRMLDNEPVTWGEFTIAPEQLQIEYIKNCGHTCRYMADNVFKTDYNNVYRHKVVREYGKDIPVPDKFNSGEKANTFISNPGAPVLFAVDAIMSQTIRGIKASTIPSVLTAAMTVVSASEISPKKLHFSISGEITSINTDIEGDGKLFSKRLNQIIKILEIENEMVDFAFIMY